MSYKTSYQKCKIFILNNIFYTKNNSIISLRCSDDGYNIEFFQTFMLDGWSNQMNDEYRKYIFENYFNNYSYNIINLFTKWLYKFLSSNTTINVYKNYIKNNSHYFNPYLCRGCYFKYTGKSLYRCNKKFHSEKNLFTLYIRHNFIMKNPECINIFMQIIDTMKKEKYLLLRRCIFLIN